MTGFKLFGCKGTGSANVEATLRLLKLPYEFVHSQWDDPEAQERLSTYNPLRQLPTLVLPSDEIMTESAAILLWLADQHPAARLAPALNDPHRAAFLRWMVYIPAAIYSMFWVKDDPSRLAQGKKAEETITQRTTERIAQCWHWMDGQIAPGTYLLGEDLSVLDIYVNVVSRWTPGRARFAKEAPKMAVVMKRVDEHPQLIDVLNEQFPKS